MKIKTIELTGAALDWAVAKCEGIDTRNNALVWFLPFESESDDPLEFLCCADDEAHAREQCENAYPDCTVDSVEHIGPHNYSTDWAQGGPIIEREWLDITPWPNESDEELHWQCKQHDSIDCVTFGPTPLIAAMRCFVASKMGDEIYVPDEIV